MDAEEPRSKTSEPIEHRPGGAPSVEPAEKAIEIKIELPAFFRALSLAHIKKHLAKIQTKATRRTKVIGSVAALALLGVAIFGHYMQSSGDNSVSSTPVSGLTKGTPDYPTVIPAGKDIKNLGGWTRVSPQNSAPVYAYVDEIGNTPVRVSQQPLPEKLRDNSDKQVAQLAQGFGATEKLTVGNATAYIGTSAEGPQSVILHKNNLLILMKSSSKIDNSQWVKYIDSLQ